MREYTNKKSGISRRDFILGSSAVIVGGAIGAGVLSGCGAGTSLKVLNPVGALGTPIFNPSPRLDTLAGKRVGMYVARRANAFEITARIMKNLKEMYPTIILLGGVEGTVWAKPSYDREGDIDSLVAEKPDAIIMALSS